MDKAQLERITQLALAAQGKPTKRPVKEILASEGVLAGKLFTRPPAVTRGVETLKEEVSQSQ